MNTFHGRSCFCRTARNSFCEGAAANRILISFFFNSWLMTCGRSLGSILPIMQRVVAYPCQLSFLIFYFVFQCSWLFKYCLSINKYRLMRISAGRILQCRHHILWLFFPFGPQCPLMVAGLRDIMRTASSRERSPN